MLVAMGHLNGPVLEFLVLFAVILLGPIVFSRLGLPGLIGLVLGGFLIGSHGLDLINAGNQTVPELGKLGLLYLMFVAGLELDLLVLKEYRRAAVGFGLIAFVIPFTLGASVAIALGFAVLIVVGWLGLPRLVDLVLRQWASDRVARYLVIVVALLLMAMLAEVFGIEGIVGAFFAGIALNRLVPNEGPSMERIEFFGAAVFVPVFLVSIGLLLDPSVMFTGHTLGLAALLVLAALGGKAIACWLTGPLMGFTRLERLGMYVLTIPQAAATLAVSLIGFEIGVFGTSVVNAVLVLILVSIIVAALLAQKVVDWLPSRAVNTQPLGSKVLVVTATGGPSDTAIRAATRLARPDGGHSDTLIVRTEIEPPLDPKGLRAIEQRLFRHGFDGHIRTGVHTLGEAVVQSMHATEPSLVIVDDPNFNAPPRRVPVLVLTGGTSDAEAFRLIAVPDETNGLADEIARRLATEPKPALLRRRSPA